MSGISWVCALLFRINNRHLEVGFLSPLAGTLFGSVIHASQMSRSYENSIDYLALFFIAVIYVGVLNSYIYIMVYLIYYLRGETPEEGDGNRLNNSGYGRIHLYSMDSEDIDAIENVEIELSAGDAREDMYSEKEGMGRQ